MPEQPVYSDLASDEDFRELVVLFVDEMPARIARFGKAFTEKNWTELLIASHQLKGSAGGYGFPSLSKSAAVLNENVRKNAPEKEIAESMQMLLSLCKRVTASAVPAEKATV